MGARAYRWLTPVLLAACSRAPEPAVSEPAQVEPERLEELEPRIVTRDFELWVVTVGGEQRYTVKSRDGQVLAEEIDAGQLRRDFSYIHYRLHPEILDTYQRTDY